MRTYRKIRRNYRENPEKVREIFETARNTDMDRSELVQHVMYLGDDYKRVISTSVIPIMRAFSLAGGLIILSPFIENPEQQVGIVIGLFSTIGYIINKSLSEPDVKTYRELRSDATKNLETRTLRTQTTQ
ncbi:MAG: hypothetical protein IIA87_04720 [Nanoarchaeota archaeon]|nr:hypothetical protein [Nanoarchaeota archaeon]